MTAGDGDRIDIAYRDVPSQAVVEAVAEAEGVPPEQLQPPTYEPLHSVIDPEALDTLFAPRAGDVARAGGEVSFRFCGYDVTIGQDESVTLEKLDD
ncbi:HalOD1 output domain-containing protein [Natronorubrum halophilum]|uniref:HalOD1 output domain-containing protein n=1 Tax=Natronorubrum halophilum TaxID=1702106 RepID=UPI000EF6F91B|nr:HalOD1 output domain-containing protein [Natronorubrum halophilum]